LGADKGGGQVYTHQNLGSPNGEIPG